MDDGFTLLVFFDADWRRVAELFASWLSESGHRFKVLPERPYWFSRRRDAGIVAEDRVVVMSCAGVYAPDVFAKWASNLCGLVLFASSDDEGHHEYGVWNDGHTLRHVRGGLGLTIDVGTPYDFEAPYKHRLSREERVDWINFEAAPGTKASEAPLWGLDQSTQEFLEGFDLDTLEDVLDLETRAFFEVAWFDGDFEFR